MVESPADPSAHPSRSALAQARADGERADHPGEPRPEDVDLAATVAGLERTVLYRLVMEPGGGRRAAYVSANVERIFGLAPAAVMEDLTAWYALIDPLDAQRVSDEETRAMAEDRPLSVEARFNVPGGQRVFAITSSRTTTLADGSAVWDGVITDVTRLWQAREERERLTQIVEATADIVGTTDMAGRLTYINEAGQRMFGLDHRDAATSARVLTLADVLPERMHVRYDEHIIPAVLRDGVWSGETTIVDARGRERIVSQVIVAHRGPDGRATHLSTILRDLSEREALENELRRLHLQSETLLGEVNHRVKNLFALLPAIVQLSARGRTDVNEVVAVVRERVTALARSHAMTLDSVEGTGRLALDALVRAVLEPYEDRADKFLVDGPQVRLAMQDGNGLGLMLHELATNAAKHGALAQSSGPGRHQLVAAGWRGGRSAPPATALARDGSEGRHGTRPSLRLRHPPRRPAAGGAGRLRGARMARDRAGARGRHPLLRHRAAAERRAVSGEGTRSLRRASVVEALTLLALLLVAMPLRRLAGIGEVSALMGPVHGLAVLAACAAGTAW